LQAPLPQPVPVQRASQEQEPWLVKPRPLAEALELQIQSAVPQPVQQVVPEPRLASVRQRPAEALPAAPGAARAMLPKRSWQKAS
jgi:hypothetical protein